MRFNVQKIRRQQSTGWNMPRLPVPGCQTRFFIFIAVRKSAVKNVKKITGTEAFRIKKASASLKNNDAGAFSYSA